MLLESVYLILEKKLHVFSTHMNDLKVYIKKIWKARCKAVAIPLLSQIEAKLVRLPLCFKNISLLLHCNPFTILHIVDRKRDCRLKDYNFCAPYGE